MFMFGSILVIGWITAASAITAVPESSATILASELLSVSGAATLFNEHLTGAESCAGLFSGGLSVGVGLPDSGVILSSGNVAGIHGPNDSGSWSIDLGLSGDADLDSLIPGYTTYDACALEFEFVCGEGQQASFDLTFAYVFGSEEYNEFVGTNFNDVFGFFLNGVNIALLPGTTTPVSINNVNNELNAAFYQDNTAGVHNIEADGLTTKLTVIGTPTSGTNTIKLAIADAGDHVLDSWIMIEGGSFNCNAAPNAECKDIQVSANGNCEHTPPDLAALIAQVDDGSNDSDGTIVSRVLNNNGPYPLGETVVTLTVTDDQGATDSCTATITVVDDEAIVPSKLQCGGPGVIGPPDVVVDYSPSYTKTNGCSVGLTISDESCSFCNGAGKTVDKLAGGSCQVSLSNTPPKFSITDSGGVGDHIAWVNEVCDSNGCEEIKCTVCVTNPGKRGGASRQLRQMKVFECPTPWIPTINEFEC